MNHTKGPWVIEWNEKATPSRASIKSNGKSICSITPNESDLDNARLIAAAPELLALAIEYLEHLKEEEEIAAPEHMGHNKSKIESVQGVISKATNE